MLIVGAIKFYAFMGFQNNSPDQQKLPVGAAKNGTGSNNACNRFLVNQMLFTSGLSFKARPGAAYSP
jgi:hypothetical protein